MNSKIIDDKKVLIIPCSGIAVGIDRLLMVITGASRLEDVIPFPSGLA